MNDDSVLLLGGGGFIGRTLARRLAVAGRTVHVLARHGFSQPHVFVHQGSVADRALVERLLQVCGTVVHLASETTPGVSAHRPVLETGNLASTLGLLEALQTFPAAHLIYFSSGGTLYGNPSRLPVPEDAPLAPLSYHGAGKAAQEMFLQAFRAQGRAVTVLRPANAYGPGQPLRSGFGLVRNVLEHVRRGTELEVWGDGEAVRDFIYVDDVVDACVRFIDSPEDNGTYNVGSGEGCSINQLIRLVGQVCGKEPQVSLRPAREGDVHKVVLDVARLRKAGWAPRVGLEEGLRRTWDWLRQG